jgi:hypothetical protein
MLINPLEDGRHRVAPTVVLKPKTTEPFDGRHGRSLTGRRTISNRTVYPFDGCCRTVATGTARSPNQLSDHSKMDCMHITEEGERECARARRRVECVDARSKNKLLMQLFASHLDPCRSGTKSQFSPIMPHSASLSYPSLALFQLPLVSLVRP